MGLHSNLWAVDMTFSMTSKQIISYMGSQPTAPLLERARSWENMRTSEL